MWIFGIQYWILREQFQLVEEKKFAMAARLGLRLILVHLAIGLWYVVVDSGNPPAFFILVRLQGMPKSLEQAQFYIYGIQY